MSICDAITEAKTEAKLIKCKFQNNTADQGGAIYINPGILYVDSSHIEYNNADKKGRNIAKSGTILWSGRNIITKNIGGGIYADMFMVFDNVNLLITKNSEEV